MAKLILGLVIPWFAPDIAGGAEAECRALAQHFHARGVQVEILTTCIREFLSDWNVSHYKPGLDNFMGIPVRRFAAERVNRERFHQINAKLVRQEKDLPTEEEDAFIDGIVHSTALTRYAKQHQSRYLFLPLPYLFGTTLDVAEAVPDQTAVLPCLHDEAYAHLPVYRRAFSRVLGMCFHIPSELRLGQALYAPRNAALVGEGVDTSAPGNAERFQKKYGVGTFVLYAGRKEAGKNVPELIQHFAEYKSRVPGPLRLVLLGPGRLDQFDGALQHPDVMDLGFVPPEDKWDAYAAAQALCQPSLMESFSIVIMEAWLSGTPVLVNGNCEATRDHCQASNGGLWYRSAGEFSEALSFLVTQKNLAARMAENGRRYVQANYTWDRVIGKYLQTFREWGCDLL